MYKMAWVVGMLAMLASGCGDDDNVGNGDGGTGQDAGPGQDGSPGSDGAPNSDGATPDGGPVLCTPAEDHCLAHNARRYCVAGQWQEETCGAGSGCIQGACVASACSDECRLGESSGGQTCELFDMATSQWVTPDPASPTRCCPCRTARRSDRRCSRPGGTRPSTPRPRRTPARSPTRQRRSPPATGRPRSTGGATPIEPKNGLKGIAKSFPMYARPASG